LDLSLEFQIKANVDPLKKQLGSVGDDVEAMQKVLNDSFKNLDAIAKKFPGYFEEAKKNAKQLGDYLDKISKQKGPFKLDQQATARAGFQQYAKSITTEPANMARDKRAAEQAAVASAKAVEKAQRDAEKAANSQHANLVRARYALYDVASEGRRVGLVMTGLAAAAIKVGADFESAFVNVARTTGLTGTALGNLRDTLLAISQTSPISFKDVTAIATLGAQMGIASGNIDEFASTVAKFSAVTGVAVDSAATSFGRIGQLLGVSAANYEQLASSVLYAGRNSLATEAQILTLTTQIAASAQQAGFAAEETVGLATALASLGIAPEQARGVILRLFGDFSRVVSENGRQLQQYASLMGGTTDEIANLWKTDAPEFFLRFTDALDKSQKSAGGMNGALSALGIVETREINVLQRLSGNHELLVKSMNDAGIAFSENTDLADQYAQRTDTLNDKLARLGNNLLALVAGIGESMGVFLKPIVDELSRFIALLTNNPIATTFAAISLVVGAAAGIFIIYKAAIAQAMASMFAMKTTMNELGMESTQLSLSLRGLSNAYGLVTGKTIQQTAAQARANIVTQQGALSVANLRTSVVSLASSMSRGIITTGAFIASYAILAAQAGIVNDALKQTKLNLKEATEGTEGAINEIKLLQNVNLFGDWEQDYSRFQDNLRTLTLPKGIGSVVIDLLGGKSGFAQAEENIAAIDSQLAALASGGNGNKAKELFAALSKQAVDAGFSQDYLTNKLTEYKAALVNAPTDLKNLTDAEQLAISTGTELADVIKNQLTDSLIGAASQESKFAESVTSFTSSLVSSKGSISAWSSSGRKALGAFEDLLSNIAEFSGNNISTAITMTAAAIRQIELAGGDASFQVQGLVGRINSMYGLKLSGSTVTSIAQLQALIASTAGISAVARAEINALLTGGSYADIFKQAFDQATKSIKSAGSAAKKEVRTLKNFASDLKSLFSDIYDNAFALGESTDNFESGWINIKEGVDEAKQSVADLKAELEDISADKAVLNYQLGIAEKYGDTLRAVKIRAQIAKLDKEAIDKNKDLTKAQEKTTLGLTGNTQAAIDNREAIRDQVKNAQDLIASYASTVQANGKLPTASQVKKYAADVAAGFKTQATSIGIAATEIEKYAKLISSSGGAASVIGRPNVKVFLDPVKTAITAYLAEKKDTKVNVSVANTDAIIVALQNAADKKVIKIDFAPGNFLGELPDKRNTPLPPPMLRAPTQVVTAAPVVPQAPFGLLPATAAQRATLAALEKKLAAEKANWPRVINEKSAKSVQDSHKTRVLTYQKEIASLKSQFKFANGGFVSGPGGSRSDSISAQLSRGEFVIQASAVNRYGVDFMNSLNQMRVGAPVRSAQASSSGGTGSSVVYLSPEDRSLLRAASERPIALYTDNQKIAQSANAGNVVLAQRGMN
jgi:TP901 family phage tail tape measure protein